MKLRIASTFAAIALFAFTSGPGFGAAAKEPAFVAAAVADPHRPKADTERDADRLPAVMLAFSGVKPGDKVAELIPAQGYSTRLLSAAVGPKGRVYSLNLATFTPRIRDQIKPVTDDPAYANVTVSDQDFTDLKLPEPVDVVWTAQNYHDFKVPGMFSVDTQAMDRSIFAALKPGGLYVIIDHAAAPGSGTRDTAALHRIDPAVVKAEVTAAGFRLLRETSALGNPNDPHTVRVPGQNGIRDKSDKFFLVFQKPR
jgi:predicted methyltransferase